MTSPLNEVSSSYVFFFHLALERSKHWDAAMEYERAAA